MGDYTTDWARYRRLRSKIFIVWLLFVPVVYAFAAITLFLFRTSTPALIFAAAWAIWFIAVNAEFVSLSCPRCGKTFAVSPGLWHFNWWIFARKCAHCGLAKYAESSNDETI